MVGGFEWQPRGFCPLASRPGVVVIRGPVRGGAVLQAAMRGARVLSGQGGDGHGVHIRSRGGGLVVVMMGCTELNRGMMMMQGGERIEQV